MKKNLKKVISAVIALALSASLIPATFAAKIALTDVADTASYATAVNTLVALDIINGYEDNSFKPDNLITRAEVTKVVVAALNRTDEAEGMTGSTGFADMDETSAWANGYINAGVQIGFINGMENNTFAPKANVTYAQIVKMLVSSMGYEEYAQFMGGWPNGYLAIANAEGITVGVKKGANDNVTREEVAQLVYNALNTPIVENTGMEYSSAGVLVPTIAKQDGAGENGVYKTILTENFNAFAVEGYVTATVKTDAGSLKDDEVTFAIAKTEKYEEEALSSSTIGKSVSSLAAADVEDRRLTPVNVGDTDAADYLDTYAQAIIMINEYDEYVMVSFAPSGKNKTLVVDADLIDSDKVLKDGKFDGTDLYVFASESATKSTKYNLNTKVVDEKDELDVKLYVNGYKVDATAENLAKYVVANNGEVELVDTYKTDGKYDSIYVDYYATTKVDSVTSSDEVYFADAIGSTVSINLNKEDNEDLVYSIFLGDEEIAVDELEEDDILSIAYNVKEELSACENFTIYVSRDVETGKLTSKNDDDEFVTIGGVDYEFVGDYVTEAAKMSLADEYVIYLDVFGKIYSSETNTLSAKYAVLDKVTYSTTEEAYKATIVTTEGTAKTYVVDGAKVSFLYDSVAEEEGQDTVLEDTTVNADAGKYLVDKVYKSVTDNATYYTGSNKIENKQDVQNRVIEYKVSTSSGQITDIDFLTSKAGGSPEAFNINNNGIGKVKMSAATKIYNAIDYVATKTGEVQNYNDLSIAELAAFVDDTKYTAYAYGDKLSDGTYPLVVVTTGEAKYNASIRFAVVDGSKNTSVDEVTGEDIYTLPVLYKGKKVVLNIADDATVSGKDKTKIEEVTFTRGDVIVFLNNSENLVDQINVVMDKADYATLTNTLKAVNTDKDTDLIKINDTFTADFSEDFKAGWDDTTADAIQFMVAPIITKGDNYFEIAKVKKVDDKFVTDLDNDGFEIGINDDTAVYTYKFANSDKTALEISSKGGIIKTVLADKYVVDGVVDWNLVDNQLSGTDKTPNNNKVNFAVTLVVDGDAVDTLVYLAE